MVSAPSNNPPIGSTAARRPAIAARRVTISAEMVEQVVVDAVRAALADVEGRASTKTTSARPTVRSRPPRRALDAAISGSPAWKTRRRRANGSPTSGRLATRPVERVDHLRGSRSFVTINAANDWDRLSLDARRALVRAASIAWTSLPAAAAIASPCSWSASSRRASPSRMRRTSACTRAGSITPPPRSRRRPRPRTPGRARGRGRYGTGARRCRRSATPSAGRDRRTAAHRPCTPRLPPWSPPWCSPGPGHDRR